MAMTGRVWLLVSMLTFPEAKWLNRWTGKATLGKKIQQLGISTTTFTAWGSMELTTCAFELGMASKSLTGRDSTEIEATFNYYDVAVQHIEPHQHTDRETFKRIIVPALHTLWTSKRPDSSVEFNAVSEAACLLESTILEHFTFIDDIYLLAGPFKSTLESFNIKRSFVDKTIALYQKVGHAGTRKAIRDAIEEVNTIGKESKVRKVRSLSVSEAMRTQMKLPPRPAIYDTSVTYSLLVPTWNVLEFSVLKVVLAESFRTLHASEMSPISAFLISSLSDSCKLLGDSLSSQRLLFFPLVIDAILALCQEIEATTVSKRGNGTSLTGDRGKLNALRMNHLKILRSNLFNGISHILAETFVNCWELLIGYVDIVIQSPSEQTVEEFELEWARHVFNLGLDSMLEQGFQVKEFSVGQGGKLGADICKRRANLLRVLQHFEKIATVFGRALTMAVDILLRFAYITERREEITSAFKCSLVISSQPSAISPLFALKEEGILTISEFLELDTVMVALKTSLQSSYHLKSDVAKFISLEFWVVIAVEYHTRPHALTYILCAVRELVELLTERPASELELATLMRKHRMIMDGHNSIHSNDMVMPHWQTLMRYVNICCRATDKQLDVQEFKTAWAKAVFDLKVYGMQKVGLNVMAFGDGQTNSDPALQSVLAYLDETSRQENTSAEDNTLATAVTFLLSLHKPV